MRHLAVVHSFLFRSDFLLHTLRPVHPESLPIPSISSPFSLFPRRRVSVLFHFRAAGRLGRTHKGHRCRCLPCSSSSPSPSFSLSLLAGCPQHPKANLTPLCAHTLHMPNKQSPSLPSCHTNPRYTPHYHVHCRPVIAAPQLHFYMYM